MADRVRTWDEIFLELERRTGPQGNWALDVNEHRTDYQTVAETILDDDVWGFESPAENERAKAQNTVYALHWYKDTPVGSYKIAAPDLDSLRQMASLLIDRVAAEAPTA